jgi:hypothetical protein
MSVGAGTAAGLLTLAISKTVAPIVKILQGQLAHLITIVHADDAAPVTYVVNDPEEIPQAVDAIPADFEVTTRSETRTRVWRDGRWEHEETTTPRFEGRG